MLEMSVGNGCRILILVMDVTSLHRNSYTDAVNINGCFVHVKVMRGVQQLLLHGDYLLALNVLR